MALPNWLQSSCGASAEAAQLGAATVYRRAEIIATHLCHSEYRAQREQYKRKRGFRFTPPAEAVAIITAMNQGDEEALKGYNWQYRSLWQCPDHQPTTRE